MCAGGAGNVCTAPSITIAGYVGSTVVTAIHAAFFAASHAPRGATATRSVAHFSKVVSAQMGFGFCSQGVMEKAAARGKNGATGGKTVPPGGKRICPAVGLTSIICWRSSRVGLSRRQCSKGSPRHRRLQLSRRQYNLRCQRRKPSWGGLQGQIGARVTGDARRWVDSSLYGRFSKARAGLDAGRVWCLVWSGPQPKSCRPCAGPRETKHQ